MRLNFSPFILFSSLFSINLVRFIIYFFPLLLICGLSACKVAYSLRDDLTPANNNINQIKMLREHLRRLAEDHNLVPMEIEEGMHNL